MYNDIKPENICLGLSRKKKHNDQLKLIDFGLCTKYIENGGSHIKQTRTESKGN